MTESSKIDFAARRIREIGDITDLIQVFCPGNRNQQHAAACILFELKWGESIIQPSLNFILDKYVISKRILERTRSKLSRLGLIEHISCFNTRYGSQSGWKLSSRFGGTLKRLAEKCAQLRDIQAKSKEKDAMLINLIDAKRNVGKGKNNQKIRGDGF